MILKAIKKYFYQRAQSEKALLEIESVVSDSADLVDMIAGKYPQRIRILFYSAIFAYCKQGNELSTSISEAQVYMKAIMRTPEEWELLVRNLERRDK